MATQTSVVWEAMQGQTHKDTYFGELIKPCKFLSDLYFDSLNSLNEQIK